MTDPVVVAPDDDPSQDTPDEGDASVTDFAAQATEFRNRFAGSQKKLTETQKERDQFRAQAEALSRWKAEKEQADMTELEKLQLAIAQRDDELAAARAEAKRERLARQFPLTFAKLGDKTPIDEDVLSTFEETLSSARGGDETDDEPRIDPNNPRRTPARPRPTSEKTGDEIEADLRAMGNPFSPWI